MNFYVTDGDAGSSRRRRNQRFTSAEMRNVLETSDSEIGEDPYIASDEDEYIPEPNGNEESDNEEEFIIEEAEPFDSDESIEIEQPYVEENETLFGKDGTTWRTDPLPSAQTRERNILRQKSGPAKFSELYSTKETLKSILSCEMCDIILRETNRKGKRVVEDYNNQLKEKYPDVSKRPPSKEFIPFDDQDIETFLGILIVAGVHRNNKENIDEMWALHSLPLIRAAMSRDKFKLLLRFIRFDNQNTRRERLETDKAAPIRDIWLMMNKNLEKGYTPSESITVDEQLFPFRGHTRFTQYIPSKPAKYGIKFFWACDSANAYPLQGQLYTGKPADGPRQTNVGERTVLDLVALYKGSGRNITTDNFFTSLQLAKTLCSWKMTLVGTVRRNKTFLPANMQPTKLRVPGSTNFAFNKDATVCSYVPKKNKSVILLSSMHATSEIDETLNGKPEIIKYYNRTKGGVDTMDKMLSEYTVKRKTQRWPLAFFFNMVDVAALAAYLIHREHNPRLRAKEHRRKFLKDLAYELCLPAVEARSKNQQVTKNHFVRSAIEMVLQRRLTITETPTSSQKHLKTRGPSRVCGSCYICRELNKKQRKTRKMCVHCLNPTCDEHSIPKTTCLHCNQAA